MDWRRNLRVMWWTQLFAVSGMALVLPFLPLLVRSLGVADDASVQRWSGAIFSAPFLFAALMTPVWGWVGDRFGRKPMVVRALLGLSLALFLMSFARSPLQLLVLRALQGTVSGFIPAAIALVSAGAPREKQGYALGMLSSAQAGGIVAGPLAGGVLADLIGYRGLFYVTAAVELLAAIAVVLFVKEAPPPRDARRRASLRGSLRFVLRAPIPVVLLGLFFTQMSLLIVQPFFALFVESLGAEPGRLSSTTGVLFGVTGLTMFLAAPSWGKLSDRVGRRRALLVAFLGGSVVFLLQGMATRVLDLVVLRLAQGIFAAGMLPALYAIVAHCTPERRRGSVMGLGSSATLLGGLTGPLMGGLLAAHLGMRAVFFVSTLLFAANALNALRLPADREPRVPRARRSWELPAQ
ncbi:MAG: MFS transporter [Candidatus Krumholzibacteriia bacterium]